ncbi:hypothetical protein C8R41DRAFT_130323 [Lentinula lateritia]|uniref:Secreted protein n=1 Tax=Lentinula lateritia TaxID=40482 RepID=A0ABQ8UWX3_9AGAR|nr:hypothetical protein C8R41DRAFT_130323 [Lentinula lateritia]
MATWMKFLSVHSYIFAQCSALHTLIHTQLHSGAKTNMKGTISLTLSTRSSSFFPGCQRRRQAGRFSEDFRGPNGLFTHNRTSETFPGPILEASLRHYTSITHFHRYNLWRL